MDGDPTTHDVTRYLSAAAYVDPDFAGDVVDEIVRARARAVAPAPSADVVTVARHCLAAVRGSRIRDAALTVIVLLPALFAGLPGIVIAVWVFSWALVARGIRTFSRGEIGTGFSQLSGFALVSAGCLAVLFFRPGSSESSVLGLSPGRAFGIVLAALWIVNYLDRVFVYGVLAERLGPGAFSAAAAPPEPARFRERLAYAAASSVSPLVVFSQESPTAPFTGFGAIQHTWSAHVAGVGSLTGSDLTAGLLAAGADAGFATRSIVFAPGWLPAGHPFLDPIAHRPVAAVAPAVAPGGPELHTVAWSSAGAPVGGLASAFVQIGVRGGELTVEVALTDLPPVDASHQITDQFGPATLLTMARLLGSAFVDVGRRTPVAPLNLLRVALRSRSSGSGNPRDSWPAGGAGASSGAGGVAGRPGGAGGLDHGARVGLRELAARTRPGAAADYEATRQVNQLSRELIAAVARILAAHGVDPAPFRAAADQGWQKALAAPGRLGWRS